MKRKAEQVSGGGVENSEQGGGCSSEKDAGVKEKVELPACKCGCAGFANSKWVGNFYPKKLVGTDSSRQLSYYQQHFSTVEINSTFYGVPLATTVQKWKTQSAPGFRFSLKAPKSVTHEGPLNAESFTFFLQRVMALGDRLQVVLLQCPSSLRVDAEQLEGIETSATTAGYTGKIAIELRNRDALADEEVQAVLKRNNWGCVFHPNSLGRTTVGNSAGGRGASGGDEVPDPYALEGLDAMEQLTPITADFVYVRLHGANDQHTFEYSHEQIATIAAQLHTWRSRGLSLFVYTLNDLSPVEGNGSSGVSSWAAMPRNAQQLEMQVHSLGGGAVPPAPKKPKKTMMSFFAKK
jgi:uncharacterized protein YecE (DUF72 family)